MSSKWDDNSIQFPRLLAEIAATQDNLDFEALAESMDLEVDNISELFDRAQNEWGEIKAQNEWEEIKTRHLQELR